MILELALMLTPDYVYLYNDKGNRGYDCRVPHYYNENVEPGSMIGMDCVQVLSDQIYWPVDMDKLPMALILDGPSVYIDRTDCRYVAHAHAANGNTSTVLDCRTQEAQ